jgi:hypothetical protein
MKRFIPNWMFLALVLLGATSLVFTTGCKDDDDDDPDPILVEDGIYVVGDATPLAELDIKGLMEVGKNEADGNSDRATMYEKYMTLEANTPFNISKVTGGVETKYGPGGDAYTYNPNGAYEQPTTQVYRGSYTEGGTFSVPTSGLYHVVLEEDLGIFIIAHVNHWGVIGAATPNGWSGDTDMPLVSAFDKETLTYEATDVVLRGGDYKFRYGGYWKLHVEDTTADATIKVNTNFGGALDNLERGAGNIAFDAADEGKYTVTMTWTLTDGVVASLVKTGDVDPLPEYPEAMYIVGDATAYGWDAPGTFANALMHKCAGGQPTEGIYWKTCFIAGGAGFKLAAENWGDPNLGINEVGEFDAEGVAVSDNGGNMSVADDGMYTVVLSLRDDQIKVSVKPAEIYGIGDAFGSWDEDVPAYLFTNDNVAKTITSPALSADGNIRMYAQHSWIDAWWNAEFNVFSGVIEYRNDGGDQDPVAGTAGQVITLNFDDNTGAIN